MQHFTKIADGIDVAPLLAEIERHPELWNEHDERLRSSDSPHRETSDLWVRYAPYDQIFEEGFFQRPHRSVWYPAYDVLRSAKATIKAMNGSVLRPTQVYEMGGVLMTRIRPGCQVYPHDDHGTWHSEYYDLKLWMVVKGNDHCFNDCMDETVTIQPGEIYTFDNLKTHAVRNEGDTDRIALIVCLKRDP